MRKQAIPTGGAGVNPMGAITIQDYVKSYKGAGIKLI